jgi:general stress protein 26
MPSMESSARIRTVYLAGPEALRRIALRLHAIGPLLMLTNDGYGAVHVPPLSARAIRPEQLWVFVDRRAAAWGGAGEREVTLRCQSPDERAWFSVTGEARVVNGEGAAERVWQPGCARWFPGGPSEPDLRLVRVSLTAGEYWETAGARISEARSLQLVS